MPYKQRKSKRKPVVSLSIFVGAYDVAHSKSIPANADSYNRHMGGIDKSELILYASLDKRKSLQWTKKVIFN